MGLGEVVDAWMGLGIWLLYQPPGAQGSVCSAGLRRGQRQTGPPSIPETWPPLSAEGPLPPVCAPPGLLGPAVPGVL